ncbi:MAG: hypothetical protein A2284_05315 [Deltaproteobacteria bacterium RIFOXYA12_FULL_61_11]|nr:MAG: hypothetical protein A2284_05315 [Deltaproteobacteria bacterium RIFOXYA12_FULL_61_11]
MKFSALSRDDELPHRGSLDHFSAFKLIDILLRRSGTFRLTLTDFNLRKQLIFHERSLLTLYSEKPEERFAHYLWKRNVLTKPQNEQVCLLLKTKGGNEFDTVRRLGALPTSQLEKHYQELLRLRYLSCFLFSGGAFQIELLDQVPPIEPAEKFELISAFESFLKVILEYLPEKEVLEVLEGLREHTFSFRRATVPQTRNEKLNDMIRSLCLRFKTPSLLAAVLPEKENKYHNILNALLYLLIELQVLDYELSAHERELMEKVEKTHQKLGTIDNENYFEVLGITSKANAVEVKRVYLELVREYHPDLYNSRVAIGYKRHLEDYFARITEAFHRLSSDEKIYEYKLHLELKQSGKSVEDFVQGVMEAEQHYADGQRHLLRKNYKRAMTSFQRARDCYPEERDFEAHLLYCQYMVKSEEQPETAQESLDRLERLAREASAPPSVHLFLGRLFKVRNNPMLSRLYYQKALKHDPECKEAREELHGAA